jgi:hypothetical protein
VSDENTTAEIKWVSLAEAPFKLRFGWQLPEIDEERPDGTKTFSHGLGWVSIYRTSRDYFFIKCQGFDDETIGAAFPIGDYMYLGADARLSILEIAEQGDIVNAQRTHRAIETAVRLAVLEGQLALRARESTRGPFVEILPSEVPTLKITSWIAGEAEDRAGGRLYDLKVGLLRSHNPAPSHSRSLSVLMSRNPDVLSNPDILRQIMPDEPGPPAKEQEPSSTVQQQASRSKHARDRRGKNSRLDWEPVLIDAVTFMLSKGKAGQLNQVVEHCEKQIQQHNAPDVWPSYESITDHVRPLWQAFKQNKG